jgi:uncharacterized protein
MAKQDEKTMIEVIVTGLTIDPFTNMPIIILKDKERKKALPIWIGLIEASSIATELEKIKLSRPMTHDLLKTILGELDVTVDKVEVDELKDNTFFSKIFLKTNEKSWSIDARPSDAIALALRTEAPIFVDSRVMAKSRKIDLSETDGVENEQDQKAKWAEILESLSPEDFGKYKM